MPGKALVLATALVAIAFACLGVSRRLEREHHLGALRRKRLRLVVAGGFGAFLLACLLAVLILRR